MPVFCVSSGLQSFYETSSFFILDTMALDHSNSSIGIKMKKAGCLILLWDQSSRDFLLLNLTSARIATESFLLGGVLWGASIAAQAIIRDIDESSQ